MSTAVVDYLGFMGTVSAPTLFLENLADGNIQPVAAPKRPRWRRPLRILCGFAVFFLIFVGPWHRSWINTLTSPPPVALAPALTSDLNSGPLSVGVGVVDLTEIGGKAPLAGYGGRAWRSNKGLNDRVVVKAVVISNGTRRVALVSAEVLIVNRRMVELVMHRLSSQANPWKREDVYFGATHTHSSPGGYAGSIIESFVIGPPRNKIAEGYADCFAKAVALAEADMRSCDMALASIEAPALIRNRTLESDKVNPWLDLLLFRDRTNQRLHATVAIFGAHATCRPADNELVSGDYPGCFCRELEAKAGGTCVFFAGSVGSMGPQHPGPGSREVLDQNLGRSLADRAQEAIAKTNGYQNAGQLASIGLWAPLPAPQVKLNQNWRLSPLVGSLVLPNQTWLQGVRIGPVVLLGAPADYSGVHAIDLRGVAPGVASLVTSFNGDYIGYTMPPEYDNLDKYEPRSMSFYGPELGNRLQLSYQSIARELAK